MSKTNKKKNPGNIIFPGFDIFVEIVSLETSDYRLENYTSRKIRLSQHFVRYMCVTKKHATLFCKSLFVFFWVIPHLTRPPHIFVLYPYPGIYFNYSLFAHIVL